jgi:phosphoglycerate dehydrogenase-like enzyme
MDRAFLATAPNLQVVLYGAGSIRRVATPALWERGVRITSAYAANAIPVSEYALAAILFSLTRGWHFAFSRSARRHFPDRTRSPAPTAASLASSSWAWSAVFCASACGPLICAWLPTILT